MEFQPENDGDNALVASLQAKGNLADWLALITKLLPFPRVMFCLYASCAAPLLHICEAPNFIIDLAGDTSRGKTTTLEVADGPVNAGKRFRGCRCPFIHPAQTVSHMRHAGMDTIVTAIRVFGG